MWSASVAAKPGGPPGGAEAEAQAEAVAGPLSRRPGAVGRRSCLLC